MICFYSVFWDGSWLRAKITNCFCAVLISTSMCAAQIVQCSEFWWVLLYGLLGRQMVQLLSRYGGARFDYNQNRSSWLICLDGCCTIISLRNCIMLLCILFRSLQMIMLHSKRSVSMLIIVMTSLMLLEEGWLNVHQVE